MYFIGALKEANSELKGAIVALLLISTFEYV